MNRMCVANDFTLCRRDGTVCHAAPSVLAPRAAVHGGLSHAVIQIVLPHDRPCNHGQDRRDQVIDLTLLVRPSAATPSSVGATFPSARSSSHPRGRRLRSLLFRRSDPTRYSISTAPPRSACSAAPEARSFRKRLAR